MLDEREMTAPCGLYCGECPNHTGKIADLARDLRKELRSVRFDKTAAIHSAEYEHAPRRKNWKDAGFGMNLKSVMN